MKIVALLVALLLSACSTVSENKPPITVTGEGSTIESAKNNAFNKAVEQEIGLVIISNRNIKNNTMVRNEILTHSAGYVDNYTIKHSQYVNGKYFVVVDVVVSSSKIAERVLGAGGSTSNVEGNKLSTQYKTYLDNRKSGVEVLDNVLYDFPKLAFKVTNPSVRCGKNTATYCFKLDTQNNAVFEIPFEFRWNYNYLTALNETLRVVQDQRPGHESVAVISKHPDRFIGSTDLYYFHDMDKLKRIKRRFVASIHIRADIKDNYGNTVFSSCSEPVYQNLNPEGRLVIFGNDVVRGTVLVIVPNNHNSIQKLSNTSTIELSHTTQNC